jgi:uncharacterized protein (DUF983 family)
MMTDTSMTAERWTNAAEAVAKPEHRPLWPAIRRGFLNRCPRCGEGRLFARFLKTVDTCAVCGEELNHHRADDLPPYLTIVVVGHIMVPLVLFVEKTWHPDVWLQLSAWLPLTLILTFALMQPIKGAVVGLQWANRMHGFGGPDEDSDRTFVNARNTADHGR